MADVKPASIRGTPSLSPARVDAQIRVPAQSPVQARRSYDEPESRLSEGRLLDPSSALVANFAAPSPRTSSWLGNPRLTATLEAASQALAPDGKTEDPVDRYAASVIETHLVARRRLSKLMNALPTLQDDEMRRGANRLRARALLAMGKVTEAKAAFAASTEPVEAPLKKFRVVGREA